MTSIRSLVLIVSSFICLAAGGLWTAAQPAPSLDDNTFSEEAVRRDFKRLYETLMASHVDLYAHRSREAYDRYYQEVLGSIDQPMSRLDVVKLLMPFVAFGKVGHARIDFPVQDYSEYYQAGGTLLPLDIRIGDGRTFITNNYSDASELAPGAELVALNGRAAADWIERTGRLVSAERPYMVHAQLESMFPRLVWLEAGKIDSFKVTVRPPTGSATTITVGAVPMMVLEQQKGAREALQHSRKAELLSDGIGYLRPGPFFAAGEGETLETFETFVDDAFRQLIAADTKDLIIDLRNNPGGDNSFSDPMIAWIADKPFRFASQFVVKASVQTREVLQGLAAKDPDGISAQMLDAMKQHKDGETFAFEIPKAQPRDTAFSGRVWALINRHTYSNATTVAAIIQDAGFGTILGEETSDLPTSYASSAQFTLPETGIVVTYPKAYFVRPSGDETLRGVVPDHSFEFPIVPAEEDSVLESALELILSEHPRSVI